MVPLDVAARFIYHSNRLDGISLTDGQTSSVLDGTLTRQVAAQVTAPDGKSFDLEVVTDHKATLDAIHILSVQTKMPVTEETILKLHKRLMGQMLLSAGEYREVKLKLKGILVSPEPEHLKPKVTALAQLINVGLKQAKDVASFAWRVHHELYALHPFIEGNGRLARLLMNLVRLRRGLGLAIVRYEARKDYLRSLQEYQQVKHRRA